jgi:hypothetical protein
MYTILYVFAMGHINELSTNFFDKGLCTNYVIAVSFLKRTGAAGYNETIL